MLFLRLLFYPLALALSVLIVMEAAEATRYARLAADMHSLAGAADGAWEALLERLSFSWYDGASERAAALARINEDAQEASARVRTYGLVAAACALLHLVFVQFAPGHCGQRLALHLNGVSAFALMLGVSVPMLTIVAGTELPLLGPVILQYESKSILLAIGRLGGDGEWLLAMAIALFSLIVPLCKLLLLHFALGTAGAPRERAAGWLRAIGKWSMADVFVVAVLVVFMAAEADEHSRAQVGAGLYFFAAYCLMSMVAGSYVARAPATVSSSA